MANPSSGYNSGKLRARTGTEGSTRGMATPASFSYARSEGGRGEGARSIGMPSPYARNESQGSGDVAYPHTSSLRRRGALNGEATAPHTAYSSERRDGGSSRDYTRSANGRDYDAPPSVRMPSRADPHTLRSERRHPVNDAASFNGRIPPARNDPPPTRRAQNMPRSTTSMRPARNASHTGNSNAISSAQSTNFPRPSISKRVRFTRSVAGSSPSLSHVSQALPSPSQTFTAPLSPSYPSLAPLSPPHPSKTSHSRSPSSVAPNAPSKEEADIPKGRPNPVKVWQPRPGPSLVAKVLRAIRRLFVHHEIPTTFQSLIVFFLSNYPRYNGN
ncbi:hypothetical protein JB92DRAFT_2111909 [Gautieria morchelliformis]|nr:hypothetical protein JB92DRAFT_2111909 [Gautieria morchelliformis]